MRPLWQAGAASIAPETCCPVTASVLSINSRVAYGYVGNAAAVFCLQRLGLEAWALDTVRFSNHPGYGAHAGAAAAPGELTRLLDGLEARGVLGACRGLLCGYLGRAETAAVMADAARRLRAARADALVLCDPVMGDAAAGLYVPEAVADAIAERVVPAADVVTPNAFELGRLAGAEVTDEASALAAARGLLAGGPPCGPKPSGGGPRLVLVTSLERHVSEPTVSMLAVTADEAWRVTTPWLAIEPAPNGGGDAVAALFLGHLLLGADPPAALAESAAAIHAVFEVTAAAGRRELALVAAQEALAAPPRAFAVERLAPA